MFGKSKHQKKEWKKAKTNVTVGQRATASTGQGGNAFAVNGSDVGVIRTN